MLVKMLPSFKQVEPQLLRGKIGGLVISQRPVAYSAAEGSSPEAYGVATVEFGGAKFIENGVICGLDGDGKIVNYTSGIHYDEELNTIVDAKKYFAVECAKDETYIRCIQLFPGDEFVTNNVSGSGHYGVVTNGIITLSSTKSGAKFYVEEDTLPNGEAGYHCVVLG